MLAGVLNSFSDRHALSTSFYLEILPLGLLYGLVCQGDIHQLSQRCVLILFMVFSTWFRLNSSTATSYNQATGRKTNLLSLCQEISNKIKLFEDEPLRRNFAACKQFCEDICSSFEAALCKNSGYVADAAAEESAKIQQLKLQSLVILRSAPS